MLDLPPGSQKQLRILDDAFSHGRRPVAPGCVDHPHFVGAEHIPRELHGEALAVVALGTGHRHQILHGRLGADLSLANELLDGLGQLSDQRQTARYPGNAPIEAPCQILKAEPEAAMQLRQKPGLLNRGFSLGCAQGSVEEERFGFVHIPNRRSNGVLPQPAQGTDSLVTVDDQEAVRFTSQGDHDDGNLLTSFGQRGQQALLALRATGPKLLVTQIKLVKLQFHVLFPKPSSSTGFQCGSGLSRHLGKWSWISWRINNLSFERVFRGSRGKCPWISRKINDLSFERVFRGLKQ